jgi:bile acid:Na+ symporter, BASS family
MTLNQLVLLALQVSIIATVFGFALRATPGDLLFLLRRPTLLARSLLALLVIMPIVTVALVTAFHFPRPVEIALVALSISPVPPLLPRKEDKAGGLSSYGLALMATLAAVSIVFVPLAVDILGRVFHRPVGMGPTPVAGIVVKMVLLPLAAGVAVRKLAPAAADRIDGPIAKAAVVLLSLSVALMLVAAATMIWVLVGDGSVIAIVLFVIAGLAVGDVLGGPEPDHSIVLALSSAIRHPGLAFSIAAANFPEERFAGTILLYVIVNAVVSIPYIGWRRKQVTRLRTA